MKTKAIVLAAAAAAAAVSCEKGGEQLPSTPSPLEIKVEFTTDNAAAMTIGAEEGSGYRIGIFEEKYYEENTARIASLLRSGEGDAKSMSGDGTAVFVGLGESAWYYACAVPEEGEYLPAAVRFRTGEGMTGIEAKPVDLIDNAEYYMDGLHNFMFRITDAEFVNTGEGFGGFWDNGTLLEINADKEWKGIDHLPEAEEFSGIYSSDPSFSGKPGSVLLNNTSLRLIKDFAVAEEYEVSSAMLGIQVCGDSITAAALVTSADGNSYSFTYRGSFAFHEEGYYGRNNYKPLLERDLEGLEYTLMKETYYCGETEGLSRYTMACVNDPDPDSPFGGYNKHCLRLNILSPHQDSPLDGVPAGTYTISADTCEFTAPEGDYKRIDMMNIENVGCYYYYLDEDSLEQTMGFLTEGTVTISRDGDSYTVAVDARTHDGFKVSGRYTGPLTVEEEPEWPF